VSPCAGSVRRVDGVVATGVGVRFDEWLFRGVDLVVRPGECAVVVGDNGSGKSTLLRCLSGEEPVTEGAVLVDGAPPDERSAAFRRAVSVLLADSDPFDELTPRQHLELLAGTHGLDGDPVALLAGAGLADRADVPVDLLSAGQRRRLLLLGATARPHSVLLLDEPERALDAEGRRWLVDLLDGARSRAAVVVCTHHEPLRAVADHVLEL
jgi:ABC-2 type transport system ATP-binding protein